MSASDPLSPPGSWKGFARDLSHNSGRAGTPALVPFFDMILFASMADRDSCLVKHSVVPILYPKYTGSGHLTS